MLSILSSLVVTVAAAQCGQYKDLSKYLYTEYGEVSISMGLASNGEMMDVIVNKETGTWSVLMRSPSGIACLVANGVDWRDNKNPKPPRPDDVRS